ncbi:DivIVA domain-containing protein [Nocardia miyunensis]|uniref:DivIVA domain-containing protein n=1 Tax=Nocardia miyunensis TaxID=282684 RepID=UPI0014713937|nr:DivIVA domain-containing protein [Nocardia miyunensis]
MTIEDVRIPRFARTPAGYRGYDAAEVDAFCERIAEAFRGRTMLTAAQIREHEFASAAFGLGGYDRDEVDDYLDHACVDLEYARRGDTPHPGPERLSPRDVQRLRFSAPPAGRDGYAAAEVDNFLDVVAAALAHAGPTGLSSQDARAIDFGPAEPGGAAYYADEVDAFLDVVVRTLAEQERTHAAS